MSHLKKFIDRVGYLESKPGKDLIMSASEARMLRDEICRLLVDKVDVSTKQQPTTDTTVIYGGKFK